MRWRARVDGNFRREKRRDIREWVDVVPVVQWALNTAYREGYASTPYHVMIGPAPLSFSTSASSNGEDWKVDALDEDAFYGGRWRTLWRRSNDCTRSLRNG